jgi:4-carboxymuconolactone decarboxylase
MNQPPTSALHILCHVVIAAALHQRQHLESALQQAIEHGIAYQALYEALLQTYLFAGFPAALEGLSALAATYAASPSVSNQPVQPNKETQKEEVQKKPLQNTNQNSAHFLHNLYDAHYDIQQFARRGEFLCERIYTHTYNKMRHSLSATSPDLDAWMIIEGYGKTLSRSGLDICTREILIVAILAALGWEKQLYSHIRGALNVGATKQQCSVALKALSDVAATLHQLTAEEHTLTPQTAQELEALGIIISARYRRASAILEQILNREQSSAENNHKSPAK